MGDAPREVEIRHTGDRRKADSLCRDGVAKM
jgi:hypothetical protein